MNNKILGNSGEEIATRYLQKKRYKILARQFRTHLGEIDVVCQKKDTVVFVEVKTRTSFKMGLPREAVTEQKQATIVQCAKLFILKNNLLNNPLRFDVIEVYGDKVNHIVDAFRP